MTQLYVDLYPTLITLDLIATLTTVIYLSLHVVQFPLPRSVTFPRLQLIYVYRFTLRYVGRNLFITGPPRGRYGWTPVVIRVAEIYTPWYLFPRWVL